MPLYDCILLVKPLVTKELVVELVARVAPRAYQRNGVVTDLKSFGTVHLGDGIKKVYGRHFQGQLMQNDNDGSTFLYSRTPLCKQGGQAAALAGG